MKNKQILFVLIYLVFCIGRLSHSERMAVNNVHSFAILRNSVWGASSGWLIFSLIPTLSRSILYLLFLSIYFDAVMPYPGEGGLETLGSSNSIEEVQAMLNARYPGSYAVYNLSPRTYRSDRWFDGRVSHRVFEPNRAPALRSLLELCLNARLWLSQKKENICVIHCIDGRALSAILVCSLLCFCRLFDNVSPALQLFSSKRGNPHLSPSQIR